MKQRSSRDSLMPTSAAFQSADDQAARLRYSRSIALRGTVERHRLVSANMDERFGFREPPRRGGRACGPVGAPDPQGSSAPRGPVRASPASVTRRGRSGARLLARPSLGDAERDVLAEGAARIDALALQRELDEARPAFRELEQPR